ncbi:6-bladed beta-propeller [Anaerobacillus isosaccharinicus]|uniref:6-bladed beta-propeller n=1 Tax=Anaerobacillus isosaccharinicus TaxID=1532552 RepID=A0A1S2LRC5_9BACI|nr:6-bladed beta-propeller [Anaerobacillus isosaccharinicus]MBA5585434.1 6-bladed beta-propeller [Anaerobacillus isosaccharinicus]QOY36248.1 6-bladed beta-propeller [Anaerobacillus isosaccharinicus]
MNRLTVYVGMVAIIIINTVVFGLIFANSSYALPTGLQGFDSSNGAPRFTDFLHGDFALTLNKPMDVTKTNEFIYVTDTNNKRVQVFDLAGAPLFTFGEAGKGPGKFNFPYGISGDNQGRVFVADMYNGDISIHDSKGEFIEYFAPNLSKEKRITSPAGLRIINNHVYVTDIQANKVIVLNMSGEITLEIGGFGENPGQFLAPNAVTADSEGNIYVVDTGNQRVQSFDKEGNFLNIINGASSSDGSSVFVNPRGIGISSSGTIYVVSNLTHIVYGFDKDGKELFQFGGLGEGPGQLYLPNGLYIDENNKIFITDTINQRISVFQ